MGKKYHTLLSYNGDIKQGWVIEFGDYDRGAVDAELDDMKQSATLAKGTKFKIVTTGDKQADIFGRVAQLNEGL